MGRSIMSFCPIPHKTRDQAWLVIGGATGAALCWWLTSQRRRSNRSLDKEAFLVHGTRKPRRIDGPCCSRTVGRVESEFFGSSSAGTRGLSAKRVEVTKD